LKLTEEKGLKRFMNKRNIVWLIILLVLVLVFIISRQRENFERRIELFNFRTDDISRIQLVQRADTLSIIRADVGWLIEHPRVLPIREAHINRFIDDYFSLTVSSNFVSDLRDRQERFQVSEDTGLLICIFGRNARSLSRMFFGRDMNNPNNGFIREANDNRIYQINNVNNLFQLLTTNLNTWRENRIVTFTENEISSISISRGNEPFTLQQEFGMWRLLIEDEEPIEISLGNAVLSRFINALTGLTTTIFFDDRYEEFSERLANPELAFHVVLVTGENVFLNLTVNDENSFVLQRNQEQETLYRLTTGIFNQLALEPERLMEH